MENKGFTLLELIFSLFFMVCTFLAFSVFYNYTLDNKNTGKVECVDGYKYMYSLGDYEQVIGINGSGVQCEMPEEERK